MTTRIATKNRRQRRLAASSAERKRRELFPFVIFVCFCSCVLAVPPWSGRVPAGRDWLRTRERSRDGAGAAEGSHSVARVAGASAANQTACSGIKYGVPRALARVDDDRINESSGLTRSLAHPDRFWTHNDGNTPRLYCISKQGETVGIIKLEGAKFDDCEDIASFNRGGKNYLLLADAGDNDFNRRTYRLHLIEEPSLQEDTKKKKKKRPQDVDVEMTIPFRYPDGPHDCEGVAVDAAAGKVYLATKEPAAGREFTRSTCRPSRPRSRSPHSSSRGWRSREPPR